MINTNSLIIDLKDVSKTYPLGNLTVEALKKINFSIKRGEFLSISGPSGSGKTTLLNIIGLIDKPSSGVVKIEGKSIIDLNDNQLTLMRLDNIGFIFQNFNLIPVLNVVENVEFPLILKFKKKEDKEKIKEKALSLIEAVGLKKQMSQRPSELSGGQRQRVAIARALVTDPSIILADEPTANLDSKTGQVILEIMKEMNQKSKTTFILSTHDPDVLKYTKKTIKIKDGQVV